MLIYNLNAIKNITVLSSAKMLFWKHSIQTFECYFERHIFDLIIKSRKIVQKWSSELSVLKTLKQKVTLYILQVLFQSLSTVIKVKILYFRFNFWEKICKLSKPFFLGILPLIYWFFMHLPPPPLPLKNRIFQWTPILLKFFIFNPVPSFKSN